MLRKTDLSGGFGADEAQDGSGGGEGSGQRKNGVHIWDICDAKLAVLVYHGLMSEKGGGDVSYYGDVVISDGALGMAPGLPGGPGRRGVAGLAGGKEPSAASESRAAPRKAKDSDAARRGAQEDKTIDIIQG